ncbi:MAG: hypothetical protein C4586_05775 [Anaerolineaceae bacterium]|nr:MAG: hypothetical protein C4586_05775 [Anaerolineaceae bacterium]
MRISELINALSKLKTTLGDNQVVFRKAHPGGYTSDHTLQLGVFYPDDTVAFMAGEQVDDKCDAKVSEMKE